MTMAFLESSGASSSSSTKMSVVDLLADTTVPDVRLVVALAVFDFETCVESDPPTLTLVIIFNCRRPVKKSSAAVPNCTTQSTLN